MSSMFFWGMPQKGLPFVVSLGLADGGRIEEDVNLGMINVATGSVQIWKACVARVGLQHANHKLGLLIKPSPRDVPNKTLNCVDSSFHFLFHYPHITLYIYIYPNNAL